MASFALPNFNLTCGVWHNPGRAPGIYGAPDAVVSCNLANGRVSHVLSMQQRIAVQNALGASASVLFPIGTDVRDASLFANPDVLEIPFASGRFYWVAFCDDIAKGFTNEHRWAVCPKVFSNGFFDYRWPIPMP